MQNTGLRRRIGAIVYDLLLVFALLVLATIPFIALRGGEFVEPGTRLHQFVLFIVIYAFFVGFWTSKGRTLGMQSWGLRVETPDGRTPSLAKATIRFFAAILSWMPLGQGFIWQIWDPDRLTWHDWLSGTRLVHYPRPPKGPG